MDGAPKPGSGQLTFVQTSMEPGNRGATSCERTTGVPTRDGEGVPYVSRRKVMDPWICPKNSRKRFGCGFCGSTMVG